MPTTTDYLEDLINQRNALAENISAKGVSASESEKLNSLVPKVNDVYEKGKEDGRDIDSAFTDWRYFSYENNRNSMVQKLRYTDTSNGTNFSYMFHNCSSLTGIPLIDTSNGIIFSYMFSGCSALTAVPALDTGNSTTFTSMFADCSSLVTIESLDLSKGIKLISTFSGCTSLENITFTGTIKININLADSELLTHDSLMSLINALINDASSKTVTIGSTNLSKLTDEEKAIATNKGWTLA